jgi:hypothetical protein
VRPQTWDCWDKMVMRPFLQARRSEHGQAMVLQNNSFVERILPGAVLRTPSGDGRVPRAVRRARRGATANADLAPGDPRRGRARRRGCDRGRPRGLAGAERCAQAVREGGARCAPLGQHRPR